MEVDRSRPFRDAGYDAIIYRSQLGETGYNVALLKVEDAQPINCVPHEVTGVEVRYNEIANRWFSMKRRKRKKKPV